MKKNIVAIVQARIGSSRLPGKSMIKVNDRPLIDYQINSIKKSKTINAIVIATTNKIRDDVIMNFCKKNKIKYFRGSESNVLERYYFCAKKFKADIVVRLTSDCPLIDWRIIDKCVNKFTIGNYNYVSNTCPPKNATYTDGMDVEVFDFESLKKSFSECKNKSEQEHVTHYMWKNPKKFKIFRLDIIKNLRQYRLTVDYFEDLILIKYIISFFNKNKKNVVPSYLKIINFLKKNPKLANINSKRNLDLKN